MLGPITRSEKKSTATSANSARTRAPIDSPHTSRRAQVGSRRRGLSRCACGAAVGALTAIPLEREFSSYFTAGSHHRIRARTKGVGPTRGLQDNQVVAVDYLALVLLA